MKPFVVFISVSFLLVSDLFGKISNGYEAQLQASKESLQGLNLLLAKNNELTLSQQRRIRSNIQHLVDYISCHELTEELLGQLKKISPDLYREIDNIKDRRGRDTDVYVKLIPKEQATVPLEGATFFSQASTDEDASLSEYGEYSISVKIWIVDNALRLLYHELGHVKYIVPNLAPYIKFYSRHYTRYTQPSDIGHDPRDQSGKQAQVYELRFRADYAGYLRNGGLRLDSTLTLMQRIRKNNHYLTAITITDPIHVRQDDVPVFFQSYFSSYTLIHVKYSLGFIRFEPPPFWDEPFLAAP